MGKSTERETRIIRLVWLSTRAFATRNVNRKGYVNYKVGLALNAGNSTEKETRLIRLVWL